MPRQRWVPNRGKQTAAPLSFKRGTERERSFFIEKSHSARRFSPQGHRVRAPCPNKRRKDCVCHRVSNNEDADPHTILNALLVLAMIEKNCTLTRMHASNKTVSEDEEEDDVFSRRPLYYGHAGSDVMGCRRPTDGVFTYVSSSQVTFIYIAPLTIQIVTKHCTISK